MAEQKKNPKIVIPLSEIDIQELMDGGTFNWTFPTEDGTMEIDVHIRPEVESDWDQEFTRD